jgi:GNAT superfamily N-acetyltransferase
MTDLRIRPATPADAGTVARFSRELMANDEDGEPILFGAAQFISNGFGAYRAFETLIAERDGRPIGHALYHPEYNTDLMRRSLRLLDLQVAPPARRAGVGRALLGAVARAGAAAGATMMTWAVGRRDELGRLLYRGVGHEQPELFFGVVAERAMVALAETPPSIGFHLRPAKTDDVPILAGFIADLVRATDGEPPAEIEEPLRRDGFGASPAFAAIIAADEAGPLGHALFWPAYDIGHAMRGSFLSDLYVAPRGRRRGVGLGLMGAVARHTRDQQGHYILWEILESNAAAIAFYARFAKEIHGGMPCFAAGEDFRTLQSWAPTVEADAGR